MTEESLRATEQELIEQLAAHRTLGAAPREELAWLAVHGIPRALHTGAVLSRKGQPVERLFILFSGRMALFIDLGAGPDKLVEWQGGDGRDPSPKCLHLLGQRGPLPLLASVTFRRPPPPQIP